MNDLMSDLKLELALNGIEYTDANSDSLFNRIRFTHNGTTVSVIYSTGFSRTAKSMGWPCFLEACDVTKKRRKSMLQPRAMTVDEIIDEWVLDRD